TSSAVGLDERRGLYGAARSRAGPGLRSAAVLRFAALRARALSPLRHGGNDRRHGQAQLRQLVAELQSQSGAHSGLAAALRLLEGDRATGSRSYAPLLLDRAERRR